MRWQNDKPQLLLCVKPNFKLDPLYGIGLLCSTVNSLSAVIYSYTVIKPAKRRFVGKATEVCAWDPHELTDNSVTVSHSPNRQTVWYPVIVRLLKQFFDCWRNCFCISCEVQIRYAAKWFTNCCWHCSMFDVGGQREERRKWIQCFNGERPDLKPFTAL